MGPPPQEVAMNHSSFLAAAAAWDRAGRPDSMLEQNVWRLLALRCWFQSDGAAQDGRQPVLADYGDACEKHLEIRDPDWWDTLLRQRDLCERCGETYRVENLAVCTGCLRTYCHCCIDEPKAPNGNYMHHCGGELVG
jgi:hypothetical protein